MLEGGESHEDGGAATVAVMGVPSDVGSSYLQGAADGPARMRQVMYAGSGNLCTEDGTDLKDNPHWHDLGDIELGAIAEIHGMIEGAVAEVLESGAKALSVGGDHSVTHPIVKAYAKKHTGLNILHLDAHPDLYDEYNGSRGSHACTFARIMEEGLAKRLVQVGIRASTPHQDEQAQRFGVEMIRMEDLATKWPATFDGPVYLSLDLDVLDPAFAPGVSHPEPGGLTTREVIRIIRGVAAPLVGADIVELNPGRDTSDIAAIAAFKLLKEISAAMMRQG
jgi:arginase